MADLSWGGYSNGQIPLSALTPVQNFRPLGQATNSEIGSDRLMPEASRQLGFWQSAYLAKFGITLNVSEAYRPFVRQKILRQLYESNPQQNPLAAIPGTSNHGFARAVDFGYPVDTFGTPERVWMGQTAASYGFRFEVPSEAWHASYAGNPTITTASVASKPISIPGSPVVIEGVIMEKGQLFRNNTKGDKNFGSIDLCSPLIGFTFHIPNTAWIDLLFKLKLIDSKTWIDLPANEWNFVTKQLPAYAK